MVVLQDRRREAQAKTGEFSRVCLAIRVGRRCQAVDAIDTIEELLKLYPPPTHLRMNNGPEFIALALQEWCTGRGAQAVILERRTYRPDHPGRTRL